MSSVTNTNYLFLSAYIRAREGKLLTGERLERMVEAADFDEAAHVLTECGYPELDAAMTESRLEEAFYARRAAFFREMERFCPEKTLVDTFRLRYDYHNAKSLIKGEGAGVDADAFLSRSGRVAPSVLREALVEDSWRRIPPKLATGMRDAKTALARTTNPQVADMILDRAYYGELLEMTESLSDDFYTGYVRLSVDVANLRSVVRCLRGRMEEGVLRMAVIAGGNVAVGKILKRVYSESVTAVFSDRALAHAAELGQQAVEGAPLAAFERECDNVLTRYLGKAKLTSFGPDVAVAYLASLEGEIMAVRMILLAKRSGLGPEKLRERLRDHYV